MKSLLKGAALSSEALRREQEKAPVTLQQEEAQCCAKVSKTVAGCHD